MSYYLSIREDQVTIGLGLGRDPGCIAITSVEMFDQFLVDEAKRLGVDVDDLHVLESSSMHFPEEATKNPKTIELAKALSTGGMAKYFNQPA